MQSIPRPCPRWCTAALDMVSEPHEHRSAPRTFAVADYAAQVRLTLARLADEDDTPAADDVLFEVLPLDRPVAPLALHLPHGDFRALAGECLALVAQMGGAVR